MNLRISLLLLLAFFLSRTVFAQDIIYTTRGAVIEGRVKSKSRFIVSYYTYDGSDSTIHRLHPQFVLRVRSSDGSTWIPRSAENQKDLEEKLARPPRRKYVRHSYRNAISVNFPQFHSINGQIGLAGGIGYEYYLNKAGKWSVGVPVYYLAGTNGGSGHLKGDAFYKTSYGYYIIPGLHYHPFGNAGTNDLSFGLSALTGVFYVTEHFNRNGHEQWASTNPIGNLGFMGQIIYRLHVSKHGVLGLEFGYGLTTSNGLDDYAHLFQVGLKLGGRF